LGDEFTAYITSEGSNGSGSSIDGVAGAYRYGFNGKENDNEVKGDGNQQDYGMRIYDPRIGRLKSVDPLYNSYPWNSPYAFAENSPLLNVDLDGAKKMPYYDLPKYGRSTEIKTINNTTVYNYTELGNKFKVAEYNTKLTDEGPFKLQFHRNLYFVYDGTVANHSNYAVGDGTLIKTKGTNWHFWKTSNELSESSRVTNSTVNGIGTAVFGAAAVGAAAPALGSLSGTYLGRKITSVGIDFTAQMIANGGNVKDINLTSLATSMIFNNTTSLQGLLLKNTAANGLQINSGSGYQGFFGSGVNNANVLNNIGAGTVLDKGASVLQHLNKGVTPAAVGRWQNLSYKPKYGLMLEKYQRNQNISNFFKSFVGQTATGTVGNSVSKETDNKNP
jgi:RHS repeat-associated protein